MGSIEYQKTYEVFTREEEIELIKRGQAGDTESRNRVIMTVSGFCHLKAKRFSGGRPEVMAELYQQAMRVLCVKFNQFDTTMGSRFSTWANWWIYAAVKRWLQFSEHRGVRVPVSAVTSSQRGLAAAAEQAERMLSIDQIYDRDADSGRSLRDLIPDKREETPFAAVSRRDRIALVRKVLLSLRPRDREILLKRSSDMTLEEIGEEFGVSRERIRQVESLAREGFLKALVKLGGPVLEDLKTDYATGGKRAKKKVGKKSPNSPPKPRNLVFEAMRKNASLVRQIVHAEVAEKGLKCKHKPIMAKLAALGLKSSPQRICALKNELCNDGVKARKKPLAATVAC